MADKYIVTDADGTTSWSAKTESPEGFKTFDAAEKRAKELAKTQPGQAIGIYVLAGTVEAPVLSPVTHKT